MAARITVVACSDNQQQSKFDNRCTGCRGLFDQAEPVAATSLPLSFLEELEEPQPSAEEPDTSTASDDQYRPDLDDDELEELLAEYFPDEVAEQQEQEHRDTVCLDDLPDTRGRRVPVYIGRCVRCGGYMINAMERYDGIKDDDVYRCFTCGWRTSPVYEINRAMHVKGM
jgi:DNA-directed RNA polymerase subunit RPC12/RpoP